MEVSMRGKETGTVVPNSNNLIDTETQSDISDRKTKLKEN